MVLGAANGQVTNRHNRQLLRYRWIPGRELHYTIKTWDVGKPGNEKLVDVTIGPITNGRATIDVRLGCRGGTCVPQYKTIESDSMGGVPEGDAISDFPLFRLPREAVAPGATWTAHQVFNNGRETVDSRYKFVGLKKVGGKTVAEIRDNFLLNVHGRKLSGERSVELDLSDGMPRTSSIRNEANVLVTRI